MHRTTERQTQVISLSLKSTVTRRYECILRPLTLEGWPVRRVRDFTSLHPSSYLLKYQSWPPIIVYTSGVSASNGHSDAARVIPSVLL